MLIRLPHFLCHINVRVDVNVTTHIGLSHARIHKSNNMAIATTATTREAVASTTTTCHKVQSKLATTQRQQQKPQQKKLSTEAAKAPRQQSQKLQKQQTPRKQQQQRRKLQQQRQLSIESLARAGIEAQPQHPQQQQQQQYQQQFEKEHTLPQQRQQFKMQHQQQQQQQLRAGTDTSLILICNVLTLLLLSLCCDVCNSNEHALSTAIAAVTAANDIAVGNIDGKMLTVRVFDQQQQQQPAIIIATDNNDNNSTLNNNNNISNTTDVTIALVTRACLQHCILEENMFQDDFGIQCASGDTSEQCYRTRCNRGCEQWWRALKEFEPCEEACSASPFYPFDMPCISACEMAQRHYWHLQRLTMEPIIRVSLPPELLNEQRDQQQPNQEGVGAEAEEEADSLVTNTLLLKWTISFPDNYLATRPFNIQYQYINKERVATNEEATDERESEQEAQPKDFLNEDSQQWYNLADYNCNENFDCEILDGLMPYTSYRFRFELPFGDSLEDVVYSPMTSVYQTDAAGAPISEPTILNAFALDHSHVAVFWQQGTFINGPLKGYKLILENVEQNFTCEQLLPFDVNQHTFAGLIPATNYTVQIAMLNEEGEGPYASLSVLTREIATAPHSPDEIILALLVSDYGIGVKSLEPNADTRPLFKSVHVISDYAVNLWTNQVFVLDAAGALSNFTLFNSGDVSDIALKNISDQFKAAKISLDWLNQRLIIAGEMMPTSIWWIVSTDFEGNTLDVLADDVAGPLQQLEADPINGWLFWTSEDSTLTRLNLANKELHILRRDTQIVHFTNDYERYLLLAYNRSDNEYYELSYDGLFANKLPLNSSRRLHGEVQSFATYGSSLMATNGTHLLLQSQHSQAQPQELWPIEDVEWCARMLPLPQQQWTQIQPLPRSDGTPTQLQALLTANMAEISWQAPLRNGWQSAQAWQQWEYELEIMDVASNSAYNIRNIQSTYFKVERLQANNLYKLRVRATAKMAGRAVSGLGVTVAATTAADVAASAWSEALLTRSWPLGEHKLLWAGAHGIYETNELGAQATLLAATPPLRDFVQLNGSVYFVAQDGRLQCANSLHPELNCTLRAANARSVAYDWRGGRVYWTDATRNCVLRAKLDGSARELLPIFDALQLQLDAQQGLLYYSTGKRLARRALSGSLQAAEELEYFHVNGGGQIRGFALDLAQQQLFWVVRQQEGHVRLFRSGLERGATTQVQDRLLPADIKRGTLQYVAQLECLMWLQQQGGKMLLLRAAELQHVAVMQAPAELGTEASGVHVYAAYTPYADESVVPETLDTSSVRIDDGYWDDFNIRWAASGSADNFTVYYKVLLQTRDAKRTRLWSMQVREPLIRITEFHQPQLLLNISITPHTFWRTGETVQTQLRTPAAAPTQPKRLRIFVQRMDAPLQFAPQLVALIRWDPPENVSLSAEVAYKVYCWLDEELYAERVLNYSSSERPLEALVSQLQADETYTFQVQAFAAGRSSGGEKTAYHALHVNPEVQSVPRLLYATGEHIAELDLDLQTQRVLVHTSSEVEHLALLRAEQRLLWVNENVELMSYVAGAAPVKLARMRAEVLALTLDWIARVVYWAELNTEQSVSVYKLDLCQFEGRVMLGTKVFSTARGELLRDLLMLPHSQTLLWLQYTLAADNATLMGRNLSAGEALTFRAAANGTALRMLEGGFTPEQETVTLIDGQGRLCAYDVQRQLCSASKLQPYLLGEQLTQLERDAGYFYTLRNDTIRAYNRRKPGLEYQLQLPHVRKIRAYHQQEYPPPKCLLPSEQRHLSLLQPQVLDSGAHYITLQLPPVNVDEACWLPLPGVKYALTLWDAANNTRNFSCHERVFNLTHLEPYTNYTLGMRAVTYYQQKLGLDVLEYRDFVLSTAVGTPSLPRNFSAYAVSPTELQVSWAPPSHLHSDKVWYQLHWQLENATLGAHQTLEDTALLLNDLLPAQTYHIWLQVFAADDKFNTSETLVRSTFETPSPLQLLERTAYNLSLGWQPTPQLAAVILVCHQVNGENEFSVNMLPNFTEIVVTELEPKTRYEFYLRLMYAHVERPYSWPAMFNERFVFETLGDTPSSPGKPQIEHITGQIFKVFWEAARDNGAPIVEYNVEALQARTSNKRIRRDVGNNTISFLSQLPWAEEPQVLEDHWIIYCNTTELSCIVRELHTLHLFMFRVRARNEPYGWGPYSEDSERVYEPFVLPEKRDSLVFAIIAPAAIVSTCVIVLVVLRMVQARRLKAKKLLEKSRPSIWSNLSTLQQQQLMAGRTRGFSFSSNTTMYGGGPLSDADIALLPNISWSQITTLNFLGSGAFGEVYEGLLKHDDVDEPEKVAIKTLRKGASESAELLQEAQLMSNFRHENIVRLIGVCFDAETISIIMEHMEGGDLLGYLRESRPNSNRAVASLQLLELLTMCIDVATGCSYLEDMHFVHRDLACRNCLVSSRDPSRRVVKIGDFGLARDIYKNDYYRKEGEGLLPVRWMAPESLVDGVFTTQSDVWSFAVLCWEILTLGQQPYAARNNFEVLSYVKDGGRMEQPDNCPDKLFELMLECWRVDPDQRPSFRKCRNALIGVKTDVRRTSLGCAADDDDYPLYANNFGVPLSSFLANPLPSVKEEADTDDCAVSLGSVNEKSDLKVRFQADTKDTDYETASDNSQLIGSRKVEAEQDDDTMPPKYYANEGISRL